MPLRPTQKNPVAPPPPLTAFLMDPAIDSKVTVAGAFAEIGEAFDGIENWNSAGRQESMAQALARFPRQHRLPVTLDTLVAIAGRINELSEIVRQSALTADDAPEAGWGPRPLDTAEVEAIDSVSFPGGRDESELGDVAKKGEW